VARLELAASWSRTMRATIYDRGAVIIKHC